MLAFRALVFTIYVIEGSALEPEFLSGDRVMVNRWSYGLRTGGEGLFNYGRVMRQPVERGDIVAFEDPMDSTCQKVLICRCTAVPGDTVMVEGKRIQVPGLKDCADADYYWMKTLNEDNPYDSERFGFVPEKLIIGRICMITYSREPSQDIRDGWRKERFLLLK